MDHQPPRFKEFFYGTLFYNYLFIIFQLAYNYIFRDFLLEKSMGTVYGSGRSAVLGTVILLVIAAATYAVMIRFRLLRKGGARSAGAAIHWRGRGERHRCTPARAGSTARLGGS